MNEHVRNSSGGKGSQLLPDLRSSILDSLGDVEPDSELEARVRHAVTANHPKLHCARAITVEQQSCADALMLDRDRCQQAKQKADLLGTVFIGPRNGNLTPHDWVRYLLFMLGGMVCVFLSIYSLATYIADSGVIHALDKHPFRALLVSFIPMLGTLAVEAYAANADSAEAERAFVRKLFGIGIGIVVVNVLAATLVFGPHPINPAAIANAISEGDSPTGALTEAIKSIGPLVLLGAQLLADTLLAPMLSFQADRLHRAGREIKRAVTVEQTVLQAEIDAIGKKIAGCQKKIAASAAIVERFEAEVALQLGSAKRFRREKNAELQALATTTRQAFLKAQSQS